MKTLHQTGIGAAKDPNASTPNRARNNQTAHPSLASLLAPGMLLAVGKEAIKGWKDDCAASMGAALAYYTAFSLAPLLIVVIAIAGLVFGHQTAQQAIIAQLQDLLGTNAGNAIADMLTRASDLGTGVIAVTIGLATLLLATTTAFVELQDDLDRIWKAPPRVGSGIWNLIESRLLSFAMVLFIGFLLTVSLASSAGISALGNYLFADLSVLLQILNFVVSLAVVTVLFALIYKVLPNVEIAWTEVWVGAAVTALLFTIGKLLIGLYIGKTSVASSFGAAGPFVVILVWIYYSTQIFLLGAEFTAKCAQHQRGTQPATGARAAASDTTRRDTRQTPSDAPAAATGAGARSAEAFLVRRRAQATGADPPGRRRQSSHRHRSAR